MMSGKRRHKWVVIGGMTVAAFVVAFVGTGCPSAPPGTEGTLAGTVTNALTNAGIAGVTVALEPAVEGVDTSTMADGTFSVEVPAGDYTVTFERDNFDSQTRTASVAAGGAVAVDVELTPTQAVAVQTSVEGEAVPGGSVTAKVTVEVLDETTTVESLSWAQTGGAGVSIDGAASDTATVGLPEITAYKTRLFAVLAEPPIGAEELPSNVPVPEGEFPGGVQDRFYVVGLNPFTLEEAGMVALEVTVNTTSGVFTGEVEVHAELPWKVAAGIHDVPTGVPVLLHGKTQASYDWALTAPTGSSAGLADADSQNPYFEPDVSGLYTVSVTDSTVDPVASVTLEMYAGTWQGAITGQDDDGRPLAANCTACHNGTVAPDTFTPWAQTGHAEIFTDSFNTSDHYGTACLVCHAVGYDTEVENGGMDDAGDYGDFLAAFTTDGSSFHADEANWTNMLADYPVSARLGNVQCENCHGPQNGGAHTVSESRISISSDVCAVCHGEPLRHARFQQWQLSGHANYELAVEEGENGSCARCHTGNGFLAWLPILLDDDPDTDPLADITVDWSSDEIHPQTCATCHDPHSIGSTTGVGTNASVRISGDTPPLIAGFTATGVGNGAICMTCHNSRRGLRNDDNFAETRITDASRSPHSGPQADVLMGQNAYLVEVGTAGSHALVEDTCVNCHMEKTPPPDLLAYNFGGSNHTFFAREDICSNCHAFGAETVQPGVEDGLEELQGLLEEAILAVIAEQITAGNTIDLGGEAVIDDAADIQDMEFGETGGRQAITVAFEDGMVVGPVRISDLAVVDASAEVLGELYTFADDRVIKAGWNWNLLNNDSSKGVHNPTFATAVLAASRDAINALLAE